MLYAVFLVQECCHSIHTHLVSWAVLREGTEHSIQLNCTSVWPTTRDSGVGNRASVRGTHWDICGLDCSRTIQNLVLSERSENPFLGLGGLSP